MGEKDAAKTSRLPSGSGKHKKPDVLAYVEQALSGLQYGQITSSFMTASWSNSRGLKNIA
jgi:hypothetical protein